MTTSKPIYYLKENILPRDNNKSILMLENEIAKVEMLLAQSEKAEHDIQSKINNQLKIHTELMEQLSLPSKNYEEIDAVTINSVVDNNLADDIER